MNNSDIKSLNICCAGFIVLCKDHVLLVSTHRGVWGFPKGKRNKNEELIECAYRELYEETGLTVNHIKPVNNDTFFLHEITNKGMQSVRLFLATTDDLIKPKIYDEQELLDAKWIKINEAYELLTLKNRKQILHDAVNHIELLNC
jgi:8-oxo-dGTP pyrophosphatase MutT (NUDIX family)